MKCPYNRQAEIQVLQWTQEPSEENEGLAKCGQEVRNVTFTLMDCPQDECGAWYNGRCNYAGINTNIE